MEPITAAALGCFILDVVHHLAEHVGGHVLHEKIHEIRRHVVDRIPGLTGLPVNHDIAIAVRLAELQALKLILNEFDRSNRPEWKADPATKPQVFIDKATSYLNSHLDVHREIEIEGHPNLRAAVTAGANAITEAVVTSRLQEGEVGPLRELAETAVLDELRHVLHPVIVSAAFEDRFRGKELSATAWFTAFSAFLGRQVKENDRFYRILVAESLGDLTQFGIDARELSRTIDATVKTLAEDLDRIEGKIDRQLDLAVAMHNTVGEIKALLEDDRRHPPALPTAVTASNIAIHVPEHFMGRDDALKAIEQALARYEGRVAITALHGLRGVGKTVLAARYAECHRSDYRATWWLRCESEPGLCADLVGLGVRLGWVAPDDKEESALAAVFERLRHEGDGILLIYDNALSADAIQPWLPRGGAARVIVTSNEPNWRGLAEPVEIRLWPKEIGADFLLIRTGRSGDGGGRAVAEDLSEALGGLPLAHEQAAAYCERLAIALAEYRRRFDDAPARLLDTEKDAPAEYHDRLTVAKTFALAIDEAAKLHPAAEPLLIYAALLAPEPIPLFLFAEACDKFAEPLAAALTEPDGLDEIVAALRAFALVDRETIPDERDSSIPSDMLRLHRLVREVAATRPPAAARDDARRALVTALAAVFPAVSNDPQIWSRARQLGALVLALVGGNTEIPAGAEEPARLLVDRLAAYEAYGRSLWFYGRSLFQKGEYSAALAPLRDSIDLATIGKPALRKYIRNLNEAFRNGLAQAASEK